MTQTIARPAGPHARDVERRPTDQDALDRLLDSSRPVVRRLALVRLLGLPADDQEVVGIEASMADDPWVRPLLEGAWRAGHEGKIRVHPYSKWTGGHWRLVALAELGATLDTPGAEGPIREASEETLAWLLSPGRARRTARAVNGRVRICASQEGNALWAMTRLGLGDDERAVTLAEHLLAWQWPDGGWNCDKRPAASHSSMNETWVPLRALAAYGRVHLDDALRARTDGALEHGLDFLLRHRLLWSERTGELMNPRVGLLRWPPYWRYGLLPGLLVLLEASRLDEPRARDAIAELARRQGPDGAWYPDGRWWKQPGSRESVELIDWGVYGESEMLTLYALEILGHTKEEAIHG